MAAPAKPTINTLPLAENTRLSFSWTNEAGVDGYYIYDAPSTLLQSISGSAYLTTVTGLTNGQTYNCYIHASNTNGVSEPAFFRPFQPGLAPSVAPISAVANVVGANSASIEWTPSGETLDAPIQWYTVQAVSDDPQASNFRYSTDGLKPVTSLFVTGLNNYSYQFAVQGVNCPGYSPPSYTSSISIVPVIGGSWFMPNTTPDNSDLTTTPSFAFTPGTSDFTLEFFIYFVSFGSGFDFNIGFGNDIGDANTLSAILLQNIAGSRFNIGQTQHYFDGPLSTAQWYHIAVSRGSGQLAIWINGVRQGSTPPVSDTTNYSTTSSPPYIVRKRHLDSVLYLTNLNFISGSAKYDPTSATITVPTSPVGLTGYTIALYNVISEPNVWVDTTGTYSTITTNANGIAWASNTPF